MEHLNIWLDTCLSVIGGCIMDAAEKLPAETGACAHIDVPVGRTLAPAAQDALHTLQAAERRAGGFAADAIGSLNVHMQIAHALWAQPGGWYGTLADEARVYWILTLGQHWVYKYTSGAYAVDERQFILDIWHLWANDRQSSLAWLVCSWIMQNAENLRHD